MHLYMDRAHMHVASRKLLQDVRPSYKRYTANIESSIESAMLRCGERENGLTLSKNMLMIIVMKAAD